MFTSEMIHAAAGVLDTNTFELKIIQAEWSTQVNVVEICADVYVVRRHRLFESLAKNVTIS